MKSNKKFSVSTLEIDRITELNPEKLEEYEIAHIFQVDTAS
jgi:hypothetical protein